MGKIEEKLESMGIVIPAAMAPKGMCLLKDNQCTSCLTSSTVFGTRGTD